MAPITWRNVEGPDFSSASRMLGQAQQSFNMGFNSFAQPILQAQETDAKNWEAMKQYNTDQFLSRLNQLKTPEELAAAQAELDGLRSGFGAQIDMTKVRDAQAALPEQLQRRVLTNQAYLDQKKAIDNRPIAAAIRQEMIAGRYKQAQEAAGIYENAGMLDPATSAQLMDQARNRLIQDESIAREKEMHKARMAEMEAERKLRNAQAAAASGKGSDVKISDLEGVRKMQQIQIENALQKATEGIKTSMFGGEAASTGNGRELIRKAAEKTGVSAFSAANANTLWDAVLSKGRGVSSKDAGPIAQGVTAVANFFKSSDPRFQHKPSESAVLKDLPLFSANGNEVFIYEKDAKGNYVKDKDGKPKSLKMPLTAQFVADAISEAKNGSYLAPSPDNVIATIKRRLDDPTIREAAMNFRKADATRTELMALQDNINQTYARGAANVLMGRAGVSQPITPVQPGEAAPSAAAAPTAAKPAATAPAVQQKVSDPNLAQILENPKRVDPRVFMPGTTISGVAAGDVDGDGVSLKIGNGKTVNLRMAYGDAPETEKPELNKPGQPFGKEAQQKLTELIKGKKLTAKVTEPANEKNYWRPVVELFADGVNVNLEMFKAGLFHNQRRTIPLDYAEAQSQAESLRLGMYGSRDMEPAAQFRARIPIQID